MNKLKRIENIFVGLLMILCGLVIIYHPDEGIVLVLIILGIGLIAKGIQSIIYYLTMARYSVGGKIIIYVGIITLDLGILSLSLTDIPELYMMIYLIIAYLFSGVIDVVRSFEARKLGGQSWKMDLLSGVINIAVAMFCICSIHSVEVLTTVFGAGLIYCACTKIAQAFRKTAIVYIQ